MIKQITSDYYVVLDVDGGLCGHLHGDLRGATSCSAPGMQVVRVIAPMARDRLGNGKSMQLRISAVMPRAQPAPRQEPESEPGVAAIHETVVIGRHTEIGKGFTIEPYAVIGDDVLIGDGCVIGAHGILREGTILGSRTRVDSFAVVGGDPQDLSFDPAVESGVRIGEDTILREGVTIHRSSKPGGYTEIGDSALLMAHSHVAHDCLVGDRVILTNNVMLAGHVRVDSDAFLAGGAGVHQFVRVGEGVMVGGNATITYDVPPFTLAAERNLVYGLNLRGLRRREFSQEEVGDLKNCYRAVLLAPGDAQRNARDVIESGKCGNTAPGRRFLSFFGDSTRGFVQPRTTRIVASGSRSR